MSKPRFASAARAPGAEASGAPAPAVTPMRSLAQGLETLGEAAGVRLLGLGERLEPLRNLLEALAACGLREARIHLRELVGLALDRRLEVQLRGADRHVGHRVAHLLQEVQVPEGVARLGLRGVAEEPAHVGIALDVRAAREVEVAAVRLRLAGERVLQIAVCLAALQYFRHQPSSGRGRSRSPPSAFLGTIPITRLGGACQLPSRARARMRRTPSGQDAGRAAGALRARGFPRTVAVR